MTDSIQMEVSQLTLASSSLCLCSIFCQNGVLPKCYLTVSFIPSSLRHVAEEMTDMNTTHTMQSLWHTHINYLGTICPFIHTDRSWIHAALNISLPIIASTVIITSRGNTWGSLQEEDSAAGWKGALFQAWILISFLHINHFIYF